MKESKPDNSDKILLRPRVTEKSSAVYTFEVATNATKPMIKKAVAQKYKVTPVRVNIINVSPKTIVYRGHLGKRAGLKKALVYLRAGDKIELV